LTPVNTKQKEIVTDTGKPIAGARDKETAEHRPTFESKRQSPRAAACSAYSRRAKWNFSYSRRCLSTSAGYAAMQEIKPDQLWEEGLHRARIVSAFGVRIIIRRDGVDSDDEITEGDFRKRFKFVADR
jgi:hypothetical protein